eukprot:gnl/TRDRNA2_/TRDRNA2_161902_c0_seq2.p1 gnl/TRDRNA2_/TRDRNA2_161902_c0~~gnl/TRDRNA2_/TRDRNA2_161902_c0_seq2.p1  ORF type:complete len:447 (+),score=46.62 gnl/TRDRNA2_/TRDRNA2_161902_c0_seq2:83-1423(+)
MEQPLVESEGQFSATNALFKQLVATYGVRFVRFLLVVYLGLKGMAATIVQAVMLPVYKGLGVSSNGYQLASVVAMAPWSAKGWFGVMSDCVPLGGYHKRGYLLISAGLGTAGLVALLVLPLESMGVAACWPVALLFMLLNVHCSVFDILSEGKYSEMMRKEQTGSQVISLVWVCVSAGGLVGSLCVYVLIHGQGGVRALLAITSVPAILSLVLSVRGDLPEEPCKSREALRVKIQSQPRLFLLALANGFSSLMLTVLAIVGSTHTQLVGSVALTFCLCSYSFYALPRTMAMANLYMTLNCTAYLDLSGPLAYYYTAGPNCVPGGPNFSYSYYLAVSTFIGGIAGMLGSILLQSMRTWSFRKAFAMTTVVQVVASVFDLVIVNRLNLVFGISDEVMYLFGDAACQQLAAMLGNMPGALLMSRLCPHGAETTVCSELPHTLALAIFRG